MAFGTIYFGSSSIGKATAFNVIVPQGPGSFPTLYLLHGLSDDHTIWHRRTSIERYADQYKLIVIMPDGGRSFYANDPRPGGPRYEDFMAGELVEVVDNMFPTIRKAASRAVAGLSMGGYGSLMLAMRHPDVFSVASSHSAPAAFTGRPELHFGDMADYFALATLMPKAKYDLFTLARKIKKSGRKLAIRMDCGTEDFLLPDNRALHAHMTKIGLPHEYHEFPGTHEWGYWDQHIQKTLKFVADRIGGR